MTSDEPTVLVCMRVNDAPKPHVKSDRSFCDECGADIWVAKSSPVAGYLWCLPCAEREKVMKFEPLSEDQVRDIEAHRKRGDA